MKENEWSHSAKEAKQIGRPTEKDAMRTYLSNFSKAIDNNELKKSFETPYGKREAEFFGRDRITALLAAADKTAAIKGDECVGIRFYYGMAYEEINTENGSNRISTKPIKEDTTRPRLFMVAVDQHGNDIEVDLSQLKGVGGNGLSNGLPKPPY